GYQTVTANLPAAAAGQSVKLRWRFASDCSVSSTGWNVDTIKITDGFVCSTSCGTCTPTITCPANVSVVGTPGSSTVIVNYPPPTVGGGCSGVTVVCTPASGSAFPVGTTTVTCTATAGSISASCTFTVSASDVCLQDDTNPATVLVFNSTTGAYTFCC